ncbi:MAG: hypothetical protein M0P13_01085 [Fibrobacteraceae bacterium]|nr:hypothetical protein [Fibrobacteraceae bacterium]
MDLSMIQKAAWALGFFLSNGRSLNPGFLMLLNCEKYHALMKKGSFPANRN